MIKRCVIIVFLHFLFAGSTGQGSRQDTLPTPDTLMIKRIAQRAIDQWATEKVRMIDSLFSHDFIGREDTEDRPDGSAYRWTWHYQISGTDTLFVKTTIKKIK